VAPPIGRRAERSRCGVSPAEPFCAEPQPIVRGPGEQIVVPVVGFRRTPHRGDVLMASEKVVAREFRKSTLREYFESIVIAVILALFIRTFVIQAFKIPTGSMENNLLIGDHLLVNKFVFGPTASSVERAVLPIGTLSRGDVVVFKYPEEPDRDFIKRVIGLPGETVELRAKKVHINGTALDEPYVHFIEAPRSDSDNHEVTSFDVRERYGPVTVPPNQYFVMGDNRDNSQDSRYWGFLPRDYVKGRALVIYWSYEAGREDYQAEGLVANIKRLASVFVHFFTRTRWDRMLHQIR
jgi:signal peptidase I